MRSRCPCPMCDADRAVLRFVGGLMILTVVLAIFGAFGCVTVPTARGTARELERCLRFHASSTLALRCECEADAERRCAEGGLGPRCFADGWVDADTSTDLAFCRARRLAGGTP